MADSDQEPGRSAPQPAVRRRDGAARLEDLLAEVARGDQRAFDTLYDQAAGQILGAVRRVVRDLAQSEEVMQEVLLEIWRSAARFDPRIGSASAWIMMLAHRRAVDRVRSEQKAADRELRAASAEIAYDDVVEAVEAAFDRERVRRCLTALTELQRESVTLAYYHGYTYAEVAELLALPAGTVKTRMRDGLIRLRDCLGVA
ncbi:MAG: ECF RNA polymerase sigma factor SigK [Streptosporangiaceae bacterium]|jgi:RNA polymerase sigma-70 factor (ECF subfamily)